MRTLGFSTSLLTASLVFTPACGKKDEKAATDAKAEKTEGEAKTADKKADAPTEAEEAKPADKPAGLATAAGNASAVVAAGPVGLIPDQAEALIGVNPKAIMSSPFYALMAAELAQDQEFQEAISTFKDCGIDPANFDSVVVGLSQTEDFVAVVTADDIGKDDKASCVIKNIQKLNGDEQVAEVVNRDGKKLIQFTDGRAYLVDDRTLVIATTAWESAVGSLIDGSGSSAVGGSKKDLFAKVDAKASVWGIAEIPAELAGMAAMFGAPPEISAVQNVAASIDLQSGVKVSMVAGFSAEDKAAAVAKQLEAMLGDAAKEAPAELRGMVEKVEIEAAGTDLEIGMAASMDELNKAAAAK